MTDVRPGGNRRIDRVLDPTYLDDLEKVPIEVARAKRQEAEQEEVDLSHLRRLLHERIDIVRAEQARRAADRGVPGAEELSRLLNQQRRGADPGRRPGSGSGGPPASGAESARGGEPSRGGRSFSRMRHFVTEPSRPDRRRRRVERLIADVDLSDVAARTDDELERVLRTYQSEERQVSDVRAQVQDVLDRCLEELAHRYAEGDASAEELLRSDLAEPGRGGRTDASVEDRGKRG
jgi:hypothetical protein